VTAALSASTLVPPWRGRGGLPCQRDPDPDRLWFAPLTDRVAVEEAKRRCDTCPIERACAAYAIAAREPHGIFGGLDERQRARIGGYRWRKGAS
jgi:WhiB family redox-sensing transcriptional regulator